MRHPKVITGLVVILLIDALVFLSAVLPSVLFRYVGSESYEWTSLKITIVSVIVGGLLVFVILFLLYWWRNPKSGGGPTSPVGIQSPISPASDKGTEEKKY